MPRRLGKRTPESEMKKHGPEWGLRNPPPDWKVMALHRKGLTAGQIAKELGTTSTYVEGVVSRMNPRKGKFVEARPAFRFAHEALIPAERIPKGAIIRSIAAGDHVLRLASWGEVIGKTAAGAPKHTHSEIQSILHPREEGAKCQFMTELRKSGKLRELLEKGRMPIKNISPFTGGKVQYLPCPICSQMNPVSRVNLRMRCSSCGTNLLSIRVRKPRRK